MNGLAENWAKDRARVRTGGYARRRTAEMTDRRSYRGRSWWRIRQEQGQVSARQLAEQRIIEPRRAWGRWEVRTRDREQE